MGGQALQESAIVSCQQKNIVFSCFYIYFPIDRHFLTKLAGPPRRAFRLYIIFSFEISKVPLPAKRSSALLQIAVTATSIVIATSSRLIHNFSCHNRRPRGGTAYPHYQRTTSVLSYQSPWYFRHFGIPTLLATANSPVEARPQLCLPCRLRAPITTVSTATAAATTISIMAVSIRACPRFPGHPWAKITK